jgi:L-2,4-diaminobutyrate decarboxylase
MKKIRTLIETSFLHPKDDDIGDILSLIQDIHSKNLDITDFNKGTLAMSSDENENSVYSFSIPDEGVPKQKLKSLISKLFQGTPRWHSPRTIYNAAPPPLQTTIAVKFLTALYNPNLALHTASGKSLNTEQKVIKAIAKYVGWDEFIAGGIFTWGGKATTMYAIKLGLSRCSPNSSKHGVKDDVVVISTDAGHPSHISDAEWLGIGSSNVIRLGADENMKIDLALLEKTMRSSIVEGKKIAAIIISGGTTNDMIVDPINLVTKLRNSLVEEFSLEYSPLIHVDAVVGFPWLFFKNYNFIKNDMGISEKALNRIKKVLGDLKYIDQADSFGIDFHKMGFCPYISSLFMLKDARTFSEKRKDIFNFPFFYSMENSRPADGPNTAYVALNTLGVQGFQRIIAHLTEMAVDLSELLDKSEEFELINTICQGTASLFLPRVPKGVHFEDRDSEIKVRNEYASTFIERLNKMGNPYYIDKIPSNATGSQQVPFTSLKTFTISPFSTKENNKEFIIFLKKLKQEIDVDFNFHDKKIILQEEKHPLK